MTARLHDILLLFVSDSGVLLHRVLRPRLLRQPALVPDRGGHQLPRHHLLQHLLPLPSRAAQQTPDQLAHGGQYLLTYLKIFFITKNIHSIQEFWFTAAATFFYFTAFVAILSAFVDYEDEEYQYWIDAQIAAGVSSRAVNEHSRSYTGKFRE